MTPAVSSWIDTHAHLESSQFADDLPEVMANALSDGVVQIVAIGTDLEDSRRVVLLSQKYPNVYASVGIHPNEAAKASLQDWDAVVALAREPKVVALGETGLDRHWDDTPFPLQQEYFERHLKLARELDLPVIIHSRECQRDVIDQVKTFGGAVRGVQHSCTASWEEAQELLKLGLFLSFAGMITFQNKALDPLRSVAAQAPLDRILVETDSPYLTPHPFRGKRNEPAKVILTGQEIARLRNLPWEQVAEATSANARRLFRLPSPL